MEKIIDDILKIESDALRDEYLKAFCDLKQIRPENLGDFLKEKNQDNLYILNIINLISEYGRITERLTQTELTQAKSVLVRNKERVEALLAYYQELSAILDDNIPEHPLVKKEIMLDELAKMGASQDEALRLLIFDLKNSRELYRGHNISVLALEYIYSKLEQLKNGAGEHVFKNVVEKELIEADAMNHCSSIMSSLNAFAIPEARAKANVDSDLKKCHRDAFVTVLPLVDANIDEYLNKSNELDEKSKEYLGQVRLAKTYSSLVHDKFI